MGRSPAVCPVLKDGKPSIAGFPYPPIFIKRKNYKMKKSFTVFIAITIVGLAAYTNSTESAAKKQNVGHQDSSHAQEKDTLGMKMGGYELDSKKT